MDTEEVEEYSRAIPCIGQDRKKHVCFPEADKCKCGVIVLRKKLFKNDLKLHSCYGCTY